jgi:glycosyltransferase involved in cell wall biosynthesis
MGAVTPGARIHVVEMLDATDGGTRTHLLQLLYGLDRARFKLTFIASCERNPAFRDDLARLRAAGVEVIEAPIVRPISPWRDVVALKRLTSILRGLDFDILHTHASKSGLLGRLAARLTGRRAVVHTPHAFYFQGKRGVARGVFRAMEKMALPWTARLALLGPMQRELAVGELGARPEQCVVIENGVDVRLFAPAPSPVEARRRLGLPEQGPVIGTLTRFLPQKATDVLLRAWARVFQLLPECRGVVVGHEGDREGARDLARRLGIDDRILWVERTEEPWSFYHAMDLFMLASRYEGMPYTLLEAMACGLPVVATGISGCIEVVEPGAGELVPVEDPVALADAAAQLLQDPERARAMGRAAREVVVRRFTRERFLAQTTHLYEEIASAH